MIALLESIKPQDDDFAELLKQLASDAGVPFEEEELKDAEPQIDLAEELREKWGVKSGDLWELKGKCTHKLLCGDSTKKEDVDRLMDGETCEVCLTDPPYSVNYDRSQAERGGDISAHASYVEVDLNPCDVLSFMALVPIINSGMNQLWFPHGRESQLVGKCLLMQQLS